MSDTPIDPPQCPSCQANEFSKLSPEDLHFLRIFVKSEGKVREMESALGLTYPTIRNRITDLKNKIFSPTPKTESVQNILEKLERKEIAFEDALDAIKKGRRS